MLSIRTLPSYPRICWTFFLLKTAWRQTVEAYLKNVMLCEYVGTYVGMCGLGLWNEGEC